MYFPTRKNNLGPTVSEAIHTTQNVLIWKNHLGPMVSGAIHTTQKVLIWKNHLGPMVSGAMRTKHIRSHQDEPLGSDG